MKSLPLLWTTTVRISQQGVSNMSTRTRTRTFSAGRLFCAPSHEQECISMKRCDCSPPLTHEVARVNFLALHGIQDFRRQPTCLYIVKSNAVRHPITQQQKETLTARRAGSIFASEQCVVVCGRAAQLPTECAVASSEGRRAFGSGTETPEVDAWIANNVLLGELV